jgi:hypothetical protein
VTRNRFALPQPSEWQRIGNYINTAMIAARWLALNDEPYGNKIEKLPSRLATAMTVKE